MDFGEMWKQAMEQAREKKKMEIAIANQVADLGVNVLQDVNQRVLDHKFSDDQIIRLFEFVLTLSMAVSNAEQQKKEAMKK